MEHCLKTLGHVLNCPLWFQGNSLTLLLHCYFLIVNVGIELKVNKRSATFTKADHKHSPKWNNGKWPKNLLVCTKVSVNVRPLFLSLQAIVKWIKITTQAKWNYQTCDWSVNSCSWNYEKFLKSYHSIKEFIFHARRDHIYAQIIKSWHKLYIFSSDIGTLLLLLQKWFFATSLKDMTQNWS